MFFLLKTLVVILLLSYLVHALPVFGLKFYGPITYWLTKSTAHQIVEVNLFGIDPMNYKLKLVVKMRNKGMRQSNWG